ncbi:hypothetical protein [Brucella pseudogrignonensis]|uniref:Uncharacterized protein n=1 Tax=Brucella pseudogrignonensis TaxID=419475 RepID=A0ABU1M7K2_9HYPH|nr:hypothetical protein [Brucella pseudogrignonensis]MDR6432017.1 hypothetical protein [Brucella pseudogrignonensis]
MNFLECDTAGYWLCAILVSESKANLYGCAVATAVGTLMSNQATFSLGIRIPAAAYNKIAVSSPRSDTEKLRQAASQSNG